MAGWLSGAFLLGRANEMEFVGRALGSRPVLPHINQGGETFAENISRNHGRCGVRMRSRRTANQEVKPVKAITAVLGGALAMLTATSAMAQTAYDDAVCREWASQYAAWAQGQANNQAVGSGALGGALLGAGIGALAGGGRGAAIGAGAGAFTGAVAGGARAQGTGQQVFWNAYNHCMSTRRPRWR